MERRSTNSWLRQGMSILLVAGTGAIAMAQSYPQQDQSQTQILAPQQLDNLVAPIALYPDPLLGQVMVAATYPVELVEAQQWLQANGDLQGQQLTDAARQQNWDASVQALVTMPDVLAKLNQDIRWATDLGNAFLAQQSDVMAAVQRLRARARQNGRLQSSAQEVVTSDNQNGQTVIQIVPADPQVIYVPSYDPAYVWGAAAWGSYPSLYYPSYGYSYYPGINIGLYYSGWGGWGFGGGYGWGWEPNWFGHSIYVNNFFFNHYGYHYGYGFNGGYQGRTGWSHDPGHRLGVGYGDRQLNNRYGAASQASRIAAGRSGNYHSFGEGNIGNRTAFRGAGAQVGGDVRNNQGAQGSSGYQRFQGGRQNTQPPAQQQQQQRYQTPGQQPQRYQAPAQQQQRYQAPAQQQQRYQAPAQQQQRYQAPAQQQQRYQAPVQQQQRYQAPVQQQQRYQAPAQQQQRYQAPAQQQQRYQAPAQQQQRYQAPAQQQRYQAPAQQQRSQSAPSYGGGGGGRSFGNGRR